MTRTADRFPVDRFNALLGKPKTDLDVAALISDCSAYSTTTVDNEDGSDYEYFEVFGMGFSLCFDGGNLVSVFLYSRNKDSRFDDYQMPLPFGITFENARSTVLARCGEPLKHGGGEHGFFGFVPEWLIYEFSGLRVHFEFAEGSQKVQMVTLMPEVSVPDGMSRPVS